jgi:hypothetical protein
VYKLEYERATLQTTSHYDVPADHTSRHNIQGHTLSSLSQRYDTTMHTYNVHLDGDAHTYTHIHTHTHLNVSLALNPMIPTLTHPHIHVHTSFTHTNTHTHTYTYIHTHSHTPECLTGPESCDSHTDSAVLEHIERVF